MGYRRYPVNNSRAIQQTEDSVAPSRIAVPGDSDGVVLLEMSDAEREEYFDQLLMLVLYDGVEQ